jgi:ABC-type multidrug transport system ATPase subunit
MRQRLGIAAALLGDPAVLIFDEPFNGMDPEGHRLDEGVPAIAGGAGPRGAGVQHLMSELQDTASHLVIVGRGHVSADTSVADLIAAASGNRITLTTTAPRRAHRFQPFSRTSGGCSHQPRHPLQRGHHPAAKTRKPGTAITAAAADAPLWEAGRADT